MTRLAQPHEIETPAKAALEFGRNGAGVGSALRASLTGIVGLAGFILFSFLAIMAAILVLGGAIWAGLAVAARLFPRLPNDAGRASEAAQPHGWAPLDLASAAKASRAR